jgi:hypothetical protein
MTEYSRLDEPGKPAGDLQQTRRDNCATVMREAGSPDKVTDAHLADWGLTREDFNEFLMDHAMARQMIDAAGLVDSIEWEKATKVDAARYVQTLKRLMPDDWQDHVPPEYRSQEPVSLRLRIESDPQVIRFIGIEPSTTGSMTLPREEARQFALEILEAIRFREQDPPEADPSRGED